MNRDGMPRAYLRIDPNLDQTMPDVDAFVRLLCSAARQPERGRFRDRSLLDRAIGRAKTRRAIERGDVVAQEDGRLYVVGWDEWQEGDYTVGERMRRMRNRRKRTTVTPVTEPPSPARNDVTTDAGTTKDTGTSLGVGGGVLPPNPPPSGGLRANGKSPRQLAAHAKDLEKAERDRRRKAVQDLNLRYYRGEMSEADHAHALAELGQVPA